MKNDYGSIMHTKWQCQYHIMIISEYQRQIIYEKYTLRTIRERYTGEDHFNGKKSCFSGRPKRTAVGRFSCVLRCN